MRAEYETYYKPSADGGSVTGITCQGRVGYPGNINFDIQSIRVMVHLRMAELRDVLVIQFRIPEGKAAVLPMEEFVIRVDGKETHLIPRRMVSFWAYPTYGTREVTVESQMVLRGIHDRFDWYEIAFDLPKYDDALIFVHIPHFQIDGHEKILPSIRFSRETGWFIYPLNC